MFQDLRFGLKLLWKEKAFTATALLTLALCIGANTAIFTVLNAVVLQPVPYRQPERLVTMYNVYPGAGLPDRGLNGVPDYFDRKKLTDVFENVTLFNSAGYDVGAEASAQRIRGESVTADYFETLGARSALGRTFRPEEAVIGNDAFVVLSYGLWKEMFARDPHVIGKDMRLSGKPYRILGVMPENFVPLSRETRLWTPLAFRPEQTIDDARHNNNWVMVGRLKTGATIAMAQKRIDAVNKFNTDRFPKYKKLIEDAKFATRIVPLKDEMVRDVRATLYLLQAAVAFVLLIGCVNVANLMLVRSNVRMKELAIRFSLGARRWRLSRQLLTESLLIALLGGAIGVAVGYAGTRLLEYLGASDMPRAENIHLDAGALAFSAALAILTGLVFGSVPLYHLFRRDLHAVFRGNERGGTAERHALWTRSALVVAQVSLAFVLLIGSGLLALSFLRVLAVDPGFKPEGVMAAEFSLPWSRYGDDARARTFMTSMIERVRATPGVTQSGMNSLLPFSGHNSASVITIEGYVPGPGEFPPVPARNIVDSGYFKAIGIPLLQGRLFEESDNENSPRVALIDEFLAHKYWPKGGVIGAKFRDGVDSTDPVAAIVGVVRSVKQTDLASRDSLGAVYFHYKQRVPHSMHVIVKSAGADAHAISAVRRELQALDPELPLVDIRAMPQRISKSLASRRAAMILCLMFGGLALLLSAVGIYGVLAYAVTQRTREFGIRTALGATAREVLGMVLAQGLKLAAIGLAIGIAAALALTRWMTSLLYEVKPADPAIFLLVALTLGAVAALAAFVPSLRAVRIRPSVALRYE